jgi:alpha-glucosidase (family GH31 glycosyl hydrolase)
VEEEENILKLSSQAQSLYNELKIWSKWANNKMEHEDQQVEQLVSSIDIIEMTQLFLEKALKILVSLSQKLKEAHKEAEDKEHHIIEQIDLIRPVLQQEEDLLERYRSDLHNLEEDIRKDRNTNKVSLVNIPINS